MMRGAAVFFFAIILLFGTAAQAPAASSGQLISEAKQHDGRPVVYEGEMIGSVMGRGPFVWINLLDGGNAIGVWVSRGLTQAVRNSGNYKTIGDRVRVSGIFHRACPEHGGSLDIHATHLVVLREGEGRSELLTRRKVQALFDLLGVFLCLLIIRFFQTRRSAR